MSVARRRSRRGGTLAWGACAAMLIGACASAPEASDRASREAPSPPAPLPSRGARAPRPAQAKPADAAPSGPITLGWREVIERALEASPRLLAARARQDVAEADTLRAGQPLYDPQVDAHVSGDYAGTGRDREATLALTVSQRLQTGGQRGLRVEAAERGLDAALADSDDAARRARQAALIAFCDLVLARDRAALARAQVERNRQLQDVAEARLARGDLAPIEASLVRLEARRAEGDALSADADAALARERLGALLGLPRERRLEAVGGFPPARLRLDGDLEMRALEDRRDIGALRAARARAGAEERLAEADRYPDLGVGLVYEFDRASLEDRTGGVIKDQDHRLGLEVSLSLPVWNRREGDIALARAEGRGLLAEERALEAEVVLEVRQAVARLRVARARVDLFDGAILPLVEETLTRTTEAYAEGQIGTLEVLRAQGERLRAALDALTARHAAAVAEAELEGAIGVVEGLAP